MMLVKVFILLLGFSCVISDGQVRQVSCNVIYWLLDIITIYYKELSINYFYQINSYVKFLADFHKHCIK